MEKKHHSTHGYWPDCYSRKEMPIKLPTCFFISIAKECGLLEETERQDDYFEQMERLKMFQQMSVACDFESSLTSFSDRKLTEEQKEHLAVIHDLTPKWLEGAICGLLIDRSSSDDAEDTAETAKLCLSLLSRKQCSQQPTEP